MRGRLFWRLGFFLMFVVAFALGIASVVFWTVARVVGLIATPPPLNERTLLAGLVLLVIGLVVTLRSLRRVTLPLVDIMEAADRVSAGDYTARVMESGPRVVRAHAQSIKAITERLQQSDGQRMALMADVAHDLRTPLTVIQGNLEGLLDGIYPRDDAHLTSILEESRYLSRLVEDLRTVALSESGALKLEKAKTNLGALIADLKSSLKTQADTLGVTLTAEVAHDLPFVDIDPVRIREVLMNLVSNALHFTPAGGVIRISAVLQPEQQVVGVAVSDTGAGIPAESLPHIFDRFNKSPDSRGSGLGLTIARSLVHAHGGEIHAVSDPQQGTIIRFTLPVTIQTT
jgi:two-component system OmpR family sensor kinase/two-component system sensor histidine kinase BaeS